MVYLGETNAPVDTHNIIKPIQDGLVGLVYDDDLLVTDVESHRRPL
ncbi:MAG TPA: RusA family crossover junction endodeoxyribonuclease [candidate division Zixibacteria bacterium]|nr:RusA family crossover junction endodeoxyribonuclease [candidate division Zixibacteria bacterium]